jgi:hypothetical protein
MKIIIGTGNAVSCSFNPTAKTLTFSGAYNFDVEPDNTTVWNTTRSAWMLNGPTGLVSASANAITFTGGLPIQQLQLSEVPAGAASGDTLVIVTECSDDIAIYNATVTHA